MDNSVPEAPALALEAPAPGAKLTKSEAGRLGALAKAANARKRATMTPLALDSAEAIGRELEAVIHEVKIGRMPAKTGDTLIKALHARLRVLDLAISDRLDRLEQDMKAATTVPTVPGGLIRRPGR